MKRLMIVLFAFSFIISGCIFFPGGTESGSITDATGFCFSTGSEVDNYVDADIILEPWYNNDGEKDPAIMHVMWGDSTYIILDMGAVDIETAESMDLSEGTTGYDEWTVCPIEVGHTYTFLEHYNDNRVYMYIKSIEISEDTTTYDATVEFDYEIVEE